MEGQDLFIQGGKPSLVGFRTDLIGQNLASGYQSSKGGWEV